MTTTMRTINVFSAHPAWGLGGAVVGNASERCNQPTVTLGGVTHYVRRAAMALLMMLLTATTAWAVDSWSGTDPYYACLPTTGSKSLTIPAGVETVYVYDDGGAQVVYSNNCNGWLTLTAPEGCVLRLSGRVE